MEAATHLLDVSIRIFYTMFCDSDLAPEDVNHLLNQGQKKMRPSSSLPYQRKRRLKRRRRNEVYISGVRQHFTTYSDAESTETGSEDESRVDKTPPNRCRMVIAGRVEVVEDLCNSNSDGDDVDNEDISTRPLTKKLGVVLPSRASPSSSSTMQLHKPTIKDYTEPWWPQKPGSVHQRLSARDTDGNGGVGRSRRQLELWEFILRSLDGPSKNGSTSAFKWVDRSVGMFRVTDTHKAAREWGLYRGNTRMDYEKMARAMRYEPNFILNP